METRKANIKKRKKNSERWIVDTYNTFLVVPVHAKDKGGDYVILWVLQGQN